MKKSLTKRIVLLFSVMLILTIIACIFFSYHNANKNEMERNRTSALNVAEISNEILNNVTAEDLFNPLNFDLYNTISRELRLICRSNAVEYIYLYTVNSEEVRTYIMTVARDGEQDIIVAEELGMGHQSTTPLEDVERAALRGETGNDYYILDNRFGKTASWAFPHFDSEGRVDLLIGVDINVLVRNNEIFKEFINMIIPVAATLLVAFAVLYILIRFEIIKPLRKVAEHMERFDPAKENEPLSIHSQDEIQMISDAFGKMALDIHNYIDSLAEITKEQEYERAQLDVARHIQYGMVPASFHSCQNGADIYAMMRPAKEVGGDFYDCFIRPDGLQCVLVADVSGKSVAGALFMALAKTLIKNRIMQFDDPADALNAVNDDLYQQNPEGMFVTVFIMLIDSKTGTVRYANAGHNPPVIIKDGRASFIKPKTGVALGLFEDSDIESETILLSVGDGVLLYTDGVTESVNTDKQFFGKDRLLSLVQKTALSGTDTLVSLLESSIDEFSSGCEQFDDMTAVSVFLKGNETPTPLALSLDGFIPVKQKILDLCNGCDDSKKIILACEEAFVNIVEYSGASEADFIIKRTDDSLTVVFRDNGIKFDPLSRQLKDANAEFLTMDEGGLGISFFKKIASDSHWQYTDGKNVLSLTFKI